MLIDRETLNLLLKAAATNPLGASTSTNLKLESTSAGFDGEEGEKMRPEVMLADSSSDSSRIVIEQLRKDLSKARSHLENQTRTIDRLQSKLDLRDRDIVDLKRAIQSGCESKRCLCCMLYKIFIGRLSLISLGQIVA